MTHGGFVWLMLCMRLRTLVTIKDMRRRDKELSKGWGQIATPLAIETKGGKQRINCANTEGILSIIQSIPSPKAEPFKQWLAKVGYDARRI